jgi:peroxiredoxin
VWAPKDTVIVVFYTEYSTPLCTRELLPFVNDHSDLVALAAEVVAIGSDHAESPLSANEGETVGVA